MAVQEISGTRHWVGLSTDSKPSGAVNIGSTFLEENTGIKWRYGASGWFEDTSSIGGADVQNPLPTDGDRVYSKDVWVEQSNLNNFSGAITDLFDNLHSILMDNSSGNPKEIFIHFNSTTPTTVIAFGAFSGDFSNIKISALVSGPIEVVLFDGSTDNTKLTSLQIDLPSLGFNALRIQFHTADAVTLSNLFIAKARSVVARIQGQKPNGDFVEFQATAGGNFKISLEEFDESFNTNPLPVIQTDAAGRKAKLDNLFQIPVTIGSAHHEIHEGDTYCATMLSVENSGNAIEILLTPPDSTKRFHLLWQFSTQAEGNLSIIEDVVYASGGANVTPTNHNRNSANVSSSTLSKVGSDSGSPLVYSGGTVIWPEHFGSGQLVGADKERSSEWILKNNVQTVIRLESEAASNELWLGLIWYEHTDE